MDEEQILEANEDVSDEELTLDEDSPEALGADDEEVNGETSDVPADDDEDEEEDEE